jgi:hypothetical protein
MTRSKFKRYKLWARSHGLVVKADGSWLGSNPGTVYWMGGSNLLAITLKEKLKMGHTVWPFLENFQSFDQNSINLVNFFGNLSISWTK